MKKSTAVFMPVPVIAIKVNILTNCMQFADFTEYSIDRGNEGRVFAVDITTGSLYTVGELSYQRQQVFMITSLVACYNCSLNHNCIVLMPFKLCTLLVEFGKVKLITF